MSAARKDLQPSPTKRRAALGRRCAQL